MEISRRANPRKGRGGIDIAIGYGEKGHKIQRPPLHWLVRREKIQRERNSRIVKRPLRSFEDSRRRSSLDGNIQGDPCRFHPTGRSRNGKRKRATRCTGIGSARRRARLCASGDAVLVTCVSKQITSKLKVYLPSTYLSPPLALSAARRSYARPGLAVVESAVRNCRLAPISCRGICTGTVR
jgi:hypothetical protein